MQNRDDYVKYNKIVGLITKLTARLKVNLTLCHGSRRMWSQLHTAGSYDTRYGVVSKLKKSLIKCGFLPVVWDDEGRVVWFTPTAV